jgi:hypothetical protein
MPRTTPPAQQAHRQIAALIDAGFAESAFHARVTLWRTPSGRKLHQSDDCGRAGRSWNQQQVSADFLDDVGRFCTCVQRIPSGPLAAEVRCATRTLQAERLAAKIAAEPDAVTLDQLQALRRLTRQLGRESSQVPATDARRAAAAELLDGLAGSPEVVSLSEAAREMVVARVCRELACTLKAEGGYSDATLEVPHDPSSLSLYESEFFGWKRRAAVEAAWNAWVAACERRAAPSDAASAAVSAGLVAAGEGPERLAQLPATCRFDAGRFATPAAWAAAEWSAAVRDDLASRVAAWQADATARMGDWRAGDHLVGVLITRWDSSDRPVLPGELTVALSAFEYVTHKVTVLARLPEPVAAWLARWPKTKRVPPVEVTDYGPVPDGCAPGLLEVIETLWRDGSDLRSAVELGVLTSCR